MTPEEQKFIYTALVKRVAPRDAEEGAAIVQLANKLMAALQPKPAPEPIPAGGTD